MMLPPTKNAAKVYTLPRFCSFHFSHIICKDKSDEEVRCRASDLTLFVGDSRNETSSL